MNNIDRTEILTRLKKEFLNYRRYDWEFVDYNKHPIVRTSCFALSEHENIRSKTFRMRKGGVFNYDAIREQLDELASARVEYNRRRDAKNKANEWIERIAKTMPNTHKALKATSYGLQFSFRVKNVRDAKTVLAIINEMEII